MSFTSVDTRLSDTEGIYKTRTYGEKVKSVISVA